MATTKRTAKGRAAARRAAGRTAKAAKPKPAPTRKTARAAKPSPKAKSAGPAKSPASSKAKAVASAHRKPARPSASAPRPVAESAEVTALKAKFQRERNGLEKRLTEAVQEIGILRHHELRAMQLERQLAERDAVISRLQSQLADLERRPAEPVYVHEVQQTLALGGSAHVLEPAEPDLDEFEDDRIPDDVDLIGEED